MEQLWSSLASHPAVQSGAVPFGLAWAITGALRLRNGWLGAPRGAGLAIGVAFLVSAWLVAGMSVPLSAVQKLVLLAFAGLLVGATLELFSASSRVLRASALGLFVCACLWLAWPQLQRDALDWPVFVLVLGCGVILYRLCMPVERHAHDSVPQLLAAVGIGGVALVSGSLLIAQLATALAVANLGFLLWNWPRARDNLGASALLGAALPLLALALMTVLLTRASLWSMAPLAVVFFLPDVASRLWLPRGRWGEAAQSLYVLVMGCIPVALAIALASLAESPDDAYYP